MEQKTGCSKIGCEKSPQRVEEWIMEELNSINEQKDIL